MAGRRPLGYSPSPYLRVRLLSNDVGLLQCAVQLVYRRRGVGIELCRSLSLLSASLFSRVPFSLDLDLVINGSIIMMISHCLPVPKRNLARLRDVASTYVPRRTIFLAYSLEMSLAVKWVEVCLPYSSDKTKAKSLEMLSEKLKNDRRFNVMIGQMSVFRPIIGFR